MLKSQDHPTCFCVWGLFLSLVCFLAYNLETLVCIGPCSALMERELETSQRQVYWVKGLSPPSAELCVWTPTQIYKLEDCSSTSGLMTQTQKYQPGQERLLRSWKTDQGVAFFHLFNSLKMFLETGRSWFGRRLREQ